MRDPDLWPVIEGASPQELAALSRLLAENTWRYEPGAADPADLAARQAAHDATLRAGGHALANLARRGGGPTWLAVVRDVSRKLRVPREFVPLDELEQQIAVRVIVRLLRGLSPAQRAEIDGAFREALPGALWQRLRAIADREDEPDAADFDAIAAALLAVGPPAEPGQLADAQRHLRRRLAARSAPRKALIVGLKLLGIGTGPVGNAIAATSIALQLAGPAYRVTIPAVLWVCVVRTRLAGDAP